LESSRTGDTHAIRRPVRGGELAHRGNALAREAHRRAEPRTEFTAQNRPPLTPLELLFEASGLPELDLPPELRRLYGGGVGFDEPCVFANFVQTIDGVVSIPELPRSNALIAGESEADRFVMGLLRACADVILVGSGTMLASPKGTWRPERVYPAATEEFAELRSRRGRPKWPTVVFVTAGGSLDPTHPALEQRAIVLTTESAAASLRADVPAASEVVAVNDGERVDLRQALACLRERDHSLILSEGGPTLFSSLLALRCVDELFLTISPLLAGRAAGRRPSLVEGTEFLPASTVSGRLLSLRRQESQLFLRYMLS
jgi:riboflavin biosynthesis pyrimidine reductase